MARLNDDGIQRIDVGMTKDLMTSAAFVGLVAMIALLGLLVHAAFRWTTGRWRWIAYGLMSWACLTVFAFLIGGFGSLGAMGVRRAGGVLLGLLWFVGIVFPIVFGAIFGPVALVYRFTERRWPLLGRVVIVGGVLVWALFLYAMVYYALSDLLGMCLPPGYEVEPGHCDLPPS